MDQSLERWRPVVGLEDRYEVSDCGRVRSVPRIADRGGVLQRVRGKVIAQQALRGKRSEPRYKVTLLTPQGRKHYLVHRLVAAAFCVKPSGCDVVNHIDNNPQNNHASNLEWTTPAGNAAHANKQGRLRMPIVNGASNPASRYSEQQALLVIERLRKGQPRKAIAAELAVGFTFVNEIACGRGWKHLPR